MLNWIKNQDGYGQELTFKINGKQTYQSCFGGVVTLLGRIGILAYVISSLVELANYQSNVKNLMW